MVYLDHGEALEADLFRVYGVDINECSVRRMLNLYSRLSFDSETSYDMNNVPSEARTWGVDTYMLANVIDMLRVVDWRLIAVNSKRPPSPPKPIKRPKMSEVKKTSRNFWKGKTIVDNGKRGENAG